LEDAGVKEMHSMATVRVLFPYISADGVMKVVKATESEILERSFDNTCSLLLRFREDYSEEIVGRLKGVSGVSVLE
ncbi:MAG: hypothetical protein K2F94_07355, partial [Muribaculaceae bacterium]|nr:hypothetical protein [Muribaculaceae bacterium]